MTSKRQQEQWQQNQYQTNLAQKGHLVWQNKETEDFLWPETSKIAIQLGMINQQITPPRQLFKDILLSKINKTTRNF